MTTASLTIEEEIDQDIYGLQTHVQPGTTWYDAGYHTGQVSDRITRLGGIIVGIADTDPTARHRAKATHPHAIHHHAFDPIRMIADCRPHATKIDIQGNELHLLNLTGSIWSCMPNTIVMEWHTERLGTHTLKTITSTLIAHRYSVEPPQEWMDALDQTATHIIRAARQ